MRNYLQHRIEWNIGFRSPMLIAMFCSDEKSIYNIKREDMYMY